MGFLARGFAATGPATEWKSTSQTLELFKEIFGTNESNTGDTITWKSALQVATVLACTRVVANGISQVPLKLFQESDDGRSRMPAKDHPLYWVLHRRPNPWQSSFEYRQTIGAHLMLCANHYSYVTREGGDRGRILELLPFQPHEISVEKDGFSDPVYTFKPTTKGSPQRIPRSNIWHIKGLSWNGWFGMESVGLARESIGLAMSAERQQARLFKNGVQASGVYTLDGQLKADQYKDLRAYILENTSGANAGMPLILDRGAKWLQQSMTGIDAQQLETRLVQIQQVCSALGVFPQMVGHADKTATFASAEQFFIAHVVHTLAPLYELIEQSIAVNLLTDREMRDGIYAKFIEEGLLRGSMAETADRIDKQVNGGVITVNEGRALLDLNPDPDPASDKLRVPANIVGKLTQNTSEPPPGGSSLSGARRGADE